MMQVVIAWHKIMYHTRQHKDLEPFFFSETFHVCVVVVIVVIVI